MKQKPRHKKRSGGLSQIKTEMQESEAFQSLSASALRVLIFAVFLNYFAASRSDGRPCFKFTNKTAKEKLGLTAQTFSRAKQELANKGFWEWTKRGGLRGSNGVASEFALLSDWKHWKPPPKTEPLSSRVDRSQSSQLDRSASENTESSQAELTGLAV